MEAAPPVRGLADRLRPDVSPGRRRSAVGRQARICPGRRALRPCARRRTLGALRSLGLHPAGGGQIDRQDGDSDDSDDRNVEHRAGPEMHDGEDLWQWRRARPAKDYRMTPTTLQRGHLLAPQGRKRTPRRPRYHRLERDREITDGQPTATRRPSDHRDQPPRSRPLRAGPREWTRPRPPRVKERHRRPGHPRRRRPGLARPRRPSPRPRAARPPPPRRAYRQPTRAPTSGAAKASTKRREIHRFGPAPRPSPGPGGPNYRPPTGATRSAARRPPPPPKRKKPNG